MQAKETACWLVSNTLRDCLHSTRHGAIYLAMVLQTRVLYHICAAKSSGILYKNAN